MKILNRTDFLKLPIGIFYSKFAFCIMDGLYLKQSTIGEVDWIYQCLIDEPFVPDNFHHDFDLYKNSLENSTSFGLNYESTRRDGLYEKEQLFAVYEKEDIGKLINLLQEKLIDYPEI